MTDAIIDGKWVDAVLRTVVTVCPRNEGIQMTVLCRAMVIAAKTCGLFKDDLVKSIEDIYEAELVNAAPPRGDPS